jgi:hypothetical protein
MQIRREREWKPFKFCVFAADQPGLTTAPVRHGVHVICYRVVWRCIRIADRREERCFYGRYATLQPLIVNGSRFERWSIGRADTRTTADPSAQPAVCAVAR